MGCSDGGGERGGSGKSLQSGIEWVGHIDRYGSCECCLGTFVSCNSSRIKWYCSMAEMQWPPET